MALTQEQINLDLAFKAVKANINAINAALANKADLSGGKLSATQVPDIAIVDYLGTVANQSAMLAVGGANGAASPQKGDWLIRADDGKVYVVIATPTNVVGSWQALNYPAATVPDNYNYAAAYNAA